MDSKRIWLKTSSDDLHLALNKYEVEKYKAIVLICHGMVEHQTRYKDFATFLAQNNYMVFTYDMRGHGESKGKAFGYFSDTNPLILVNDLKDVVEYIRSNYHGKLYLFAHSMGTITTRNFLMDYSNLVDKVILSGAPNPNALAGFGKNLAGLIKVLGGSLGHSRLLTGLSIGYFNKKIKNPKTSHDWLSYNEENIKAYMNDELSQFTFTNSGYKTLFYMVKRMHKTKKYKNVNKSLPITFLWGEEDAASGGVKGRKAAYNDLKKAGFNKVKKTVYEHMRHEILNEIDREIVYDEVLSLFDSNMDYCPKCGNLLIKRYLENEGDVDYCLECDKYYFAYFAVAVSLIVRYKDEILLIKQHHKDRYILVAGYISKYESAEEAAIRELKEETNLECKNIKTLRTEYFQPSNTLMINMLAEVTSKDFHLNAEVDEAKWFNLEEASKNIAPGSLASHFLEKYLEGGK